MTQEFLRTEEVEALLSSNLELCFIRHGMPARDPQVGQYYLGITDSDFKRVDNLVQQLDPQRGDVLAVESFGNDRSEGKVVSKGQLGMQISHDLNESVLAQALLAKRLGSGRLPTLEDMLAVHRQANSTSPIRYAAGRAAAKGVRVEIADMSKEDAVAWDKTVAEVHPLLRIALDMKSLKIVDGRNYYMLKGLGLTAMNMQTGGAAPDARLGYIAGLGHASGMARLLHSYRIPASSIDAGMPIGIVDATNYLDLLTFPVSNRLQRRRLRSMLTNS